MSNLLRVSEAASMGLHAMALLAVDPERLLSTREAASLLGVSEAHLAKVFQRLARVGLVDSIRGPKGGFLLARQPSTITLLEVFEAIEGPIVVRACLFSSRLCDGENCIFGHLLESVDSEAKDYFGKTKLSEVVGTIQTAFKGAKKPYGNA
jgi:Rrf2 family protein